MEPGTAIGTGLALFASKDLIVKILGPTADYLGVKIRIWSERGVDNLERIFKSAERRLGDKIEEPGQVPPKIVKEILNHGPFCDDELSAEYFGGVLASSRTSVSRDDRATSLLALIGRLSTYQIRAHYVFYSVLKSLFDGNPIDLFHLQKREKLQIYIPEIVFFKAMDFGNNENPNTLLPHILSGLDRENLIGDAYASGSADVISQFLQSRIERFSGDLASKLINRRVKSPGITYFPSIPGIELFLWAHGLRDQPIPSFLRRETQFETLAPVVIEPGAEKGILSV